MQTVIRDIAPPAQALDATVPDPGPLDGPAPDEVVEVVPETCCLAC